MLMSDVLRREIQENWVPIFALECSICYSDLANGEGIILDCYHLLCLKCMWAHIKIAEEEEEQVYCPVWSCKLQFQDNATSKTERYLSNLLSRGEAMRCPGCTVIVQKDGGLCDGMKCTICGIYLCWATKGARWGPGGRGDISGGCRCHVDGSPCTPTCKSCQFYYLSDHDYL